MGQAVRDVDADAARADDRHGVAGHAVGERPRVGHDVRQVAAGHVDLPRPDAGREDGAVEARELVRVALAEPPPEPDVDAEPVQLGREVAGSCRRTSPCPAPAAPGGTGRPARRRPRRGRPGRRARRAPARPPCRPGRRRSPRSAATSPRARARSRGPARGLTMQDTPRSTIDRSMQAWLQAMQRFDRPAVAARPTSSASARNGRAIETKSTAGVAQQPLRRLHAGDPVARDHRQLADRRLDRLGTREARPRRHRALHGRHRRFVPPDADVQRIDARAGQRRGERQHLLERRRPGHQVGAGHAEDHRERRRRPPRAPRARPRRRSAAAARRRRPSRRRAGSSAARGTGRRGSPPSPSPRPRRSRAPARGARPRRTRR